MNDAERGAHPDLEKLADHAAGATAPGIRESIEDHLAACPTCRVEVARLARFAAIEGDADLAREAGWAEAEARLEAGLPAVLQQGRLGPARPRRWLPMARWLAPAAAAAVVAMILFGLPGEEARQTGDDLAGPRRGESTPAREIVLESPTGVLDAAPRMFRWRPGARFESYTLEIVTPALELVYRQAAIADTAVAASDSLRRLLAPDTPYLWSVRGDRAARAAAVSAHAWFRIQPR